MRHIKVHTLKGVFEKVGKISEECTRLQTYDFIQTHQGFIVNMFYIKQILDQEIILSNGECVSMSFRKKKEVINAYNKYLTQYGL